MARPSRVDRLPDEIRDQIARLREQGWTIDELLTRLRELDVDVSRSSLGRHVKGLDEISADIRAARAMATDIVAAIGEGGENRIVQANIELLHAAVLDMHRRAKAEGTDGPASTPTGAMQLARALDSLTKARRQDLAFVEQVEKRVAERARADAAGAAETEGKKRGLSADTMAAIRASILGVSV